MIAIRGGKTARRRDEGLVALEFVAALPLLIALGMFLLQIGLLFAGILGANGAARAAARADAQGSNTAAAAEESLPRWLQDGMEVTTPRPGETRLLVTVPSVIPAFGPFDVRRTVHMATGE